MRKMKKVFAGALTGAMALSMLAMPAAAEEVVYEAADLADIIPEETITLDVYSQLANYSGEQIGWFAQVMEEKFNVKLNIISNAGDGVFATRMESGDLGDIVVFGNDGDEYLQAVEGGMLFDWEEDEILTDYGPYIAANMADALEKNRVLSGGTLYGFGHNVGTSADDHESFFYHPDLRFDLYQQIGCPEINTLEDYVDVLAQMVEACPTDDKGGKTYGMSLFADWDGDMVMFVKAMGAFYGYDEFGIGLYDVTTNEWECCLQEGGMYERSMRFFNALYQKGLLDPDSMTQGYDGMTEDYQNGTAFLQIFDWMGSGLYNSEAHVAEGKAMLTVPAEEFKTLCYGLNKAGGNRIWSIGANSDYPELCMAIINWFSTPEGRMTTEYGPQGVTWDYDEEGQPYLTELGLSCKADIQTEMTGDYSGSFGDGQFQINNTTWSIDAANPMATDATYNYKNWESYNAKESTEIEKQWAEWAGTPVLNDFLESKDYGVAVGTTFAMAPRSDELSTTWAQVTETIKNYTWQAIYAENDEQFESLLSEMRTRCEEYGVADCIAFCEEQAAIRKAAVEAVIAE